MFGTALDKVQALFSRDFLLASFSPWLLFAAANASMLELVAPGVARPIGWYLALAPAGQALAAAAALVGLVALAYAASPAIGPLRALLEGRLFLPRRLAGRMRETQWARWSALRAEIRELEGFERRLSGDKDVLLARLRFARRIGDAHPGRGAPGVVVGAAKATRRLVRAAGSVADLRPALDEAVGRAVLALARNPAARRPEVDAMHRELIDVLGHLPDQVLGAAIRLREARDRRFSRLDLAPSAIGNAAAAVHGYVHTRYGADLGTLLPRLQLVLAPDGAAMRAIQDTETRFDFFAQSIGLTVLFVGLWLLPVALQSWTGLLALAVLGPLLVRGLHALALEARLAQGEAVRAAIDLHRFEVLRGLHQALPSTSDGERRLWDSLRRALDYGEPQRLHYRPDPPG